MKKVLFTAALSFAVCLASFAQNEKFVQAMTGTLTALRESKNMNDPAPMTEAANRFERIATAEKSEWLPRYHAAYCYTVIGFMSKSNTEKDQYFDKADALLKEAEALVSKPSDEIMVMKAYVAQGRIAVDPMSRWQTYGASFQELIAKSKALNPENPRAYALEGMMLYYTPEQFGGGKVVACPILTKAVQKYESFKPESEIHPTWGSNMVKSLTAECPSK